MKPVKTTLAVLLVASCFACAREARAAALGTYLIPALEKADLRDAQPSGRALRVQLRTAAPTQPRQVEVELLVEGDPPFESNKPVQFAVRAEPGGQGLEYRYFFGDGPPTGWVSDSRYPHNFVNAGTYPVYVEVRSNLGAFAFADAWRSNLLRVQVAQKERPISVNLETLDSPPFRVSEPLRFAARTEMTGLRLEYQFLFGDGRATAWTRENLVRHAYTEPGTYQAVVYVREQPSEGQGTPVATSSSRATLRVIIQAGSRTDGYQAVRLIADPVEIQAGNPVRLRAHVEPEIEGVVFVFDFGDGQRSESLPDNVAVHRYASPGAYVTSVRVYKGEGLVGESQPISINVTPRITHRLLLEADSTRPGTTEQMRFTWNVEPYVKGVLYHIDFGDSYSGWTSETHAEHRYQAGGEYRVLLKARIGETDIQSNELVVTVREVVRPWLYLSLAIALGAAGASALVWHIIARAGNRKSGKGLKAEAINMIVDARPRLDPGTQQLEFSTLVGASPDVRFRPIPDIGEQSMEHGFSTRKRKEDTHG